MIPKPLKDIRLQDLEALVGVARESKTLEFKAEVPRKSDSDLVPFIAGVSSLANTAGGDFVLGVVAHEGVATAVPGVAVPNLDAEKLRLEQALANGLEPRLRGSTSKSSIAAPTSMWWLSACRAAGLDHIVSRQTIASMAATPAENIRSMSVSCARLSSCPNPSLTGSEASGHNGLRGLGATKRPFRFPRWGRAILHIVPFPPLSGIGRANQVAVNLDGFVNFVGDGRDRTSSYAQFFRNGATEGVLALGTDEKNGRAYIAGPSLCTQIAFAVRQYVDVLNAYEMGFPVFALLSFTDMDGSTLRYNSGFGSGFSVAGPRSGTVITLPEIALEGPVKDAPAALKPVFNALWNAFGFLQCDMYDGQGTWTGNK
jgi:hypothetical protein